MALKRPITSGMILFIRAYQCCLRPFLIGQCKFLPTCSEYAIEAIRIHGPIKGGWLALKRILRCHPFSRGGIDAVPAAHTNAGKPGTPGGAPGR
jgi:putative membrane protein insertion efficiency factor